MGVTPARCTRRVWSSMKNRTKIVLNLIVSTVKKSQARIPVACDRRNCDHVGLAGRGAGSRPWRSRMVRIVVAETRSPSFSSSPRIRC
jgi:hypothetical protein